MRNGKPGPGREAGFTYVGLIVLVTIIGLVGAATLKADALLRRAAAEEELLEIGAAFSAALTSYAEATPRGQLPQPPTLDDLLKDPRFPGTRRHLRKIFVDPITGKAEWGVVWVNKGNGINGAGGSGVLAVYSLSASKPLKQANFDARFLGLENQKHLSDWKFAALGRGVAQGQPGQPGQPQQLGQPLQPGQLGQPGQPPQPGQPGQPQNPAEPPSLFPERGNPTPLRPAPAEPTPPPPAPAVAPAERAAQPEAPEPPQPADASSAGDDEKDEKDEKEKTDRDTRDASRR